MCMQSTSSDPTPSDSTIIRTGSDGRLRYSPTPRQELLDAFAHSGMSAMNFSRQHGVHYQTHMDRARSGGVTIFCWQSRGQPGKLSAT